MDDFKCEILETGEERRKEIIAKADAQRQWSFVSMRRGRSDIDEFLVERREDGSHRVFEYLRRRTTIIGPFREIVPDDGISRGRFNDRRSGPENDRLYREFEGAKLHHRKTSPYAMPKDLVARLRDEYADLLALGRPAEEFSATIVQAIKAGEKKFRLAQKNGPKTKHK
jgi:hypothetical protein